MAKSSFVYVSYIRTTPEKLWLALTDAAFMTQYWFGMHAESGWTAGSPWKLVSGEGQVYDAGEIVEALPKVTLVSIGHRSTLAQFHKRRITIETHPGEPSTLTV